MYTKNKKLLSAAIYAFLFSIITYTLPLWKYGKIHIIGDSHSAFCYTSKPDINPWNYNPKPNTTEALTYEQFSFPYHINPNDTINVDFAIHWVQGRTMHRIGRDGAKAFDIALYEVKDTDVAVFLFGAIDVGSHIFKDEPFRQVIFGRNLDEVVETLTSKYIATILDIKKMYPNVTVVVQAVVPFYTNPPQNASCEFNHSFPDQSFVNYQINVTTKTNKKLQEYCQKNNVLFFNINHLYETAEGALRPDLSDGHHHIGIKYNQPFKEHLITLLMQ